MEFEEKVTVRQIKRILQDPSAPIEERYGTAKETIEYCKNMYFVLGRKGTGLITRVHKVLEDPNRRLGSREHFMYPRNKPAFLPI